jgi:uncharacterized protein (DUF4415 family)
MDLKKQTSKQRKHYSYMMDAMQRLEWDLHHHIEATSRIPDEWHEIAKRRGPQPKVKVTMRLDTDVLRFFKSMGAGHLPRMNEVLVSYMQARLAGVIRGAETIDHFRNAETFHNTPRRPMWGDFDRMLGEAAPPTRAEEDASIMESLRDDLKLRRVTE